MKSSIALALAFLLNGNFAYANMCESLFDSLKLGTREEIVSPSQSILPYQLDLNVNFPIAKTHPEAWNGKIQITREGLVTIQPWNNPSRTILLKNMRLKGKVAAASTFKQDLAVMTEDGEIKIFHKLDSVGAHQYVHEIDAAKGKTAGQTVDIALSKGTLYVARWISGHSGMLTTVRARSRDGWAGKPETTSFTDRFLIPREHVLEGLFIENDRLMANVRHEKTGIRRLVAIEDVHYRETSTDSPLTYKWPLQLPNKSIEAISRQSYPAPTTVKDSNGRFHNPQRGYLPYVIQTNPKSRTGYMFSENWGDIVTGTIMPEQGITKLYRPFIAPVEYPRTPLAAVATDGKDVIVLGKTGESYVIKNFMETRHKMEKGPSVELTRTQEGDLHADVAMDDKHIFFASQGFEVLSIQIHRRFGHNEWAALHVELPSKAVFNGLRIENGVLIVNLRFVDQTNRDMPILTTGSLTIGDRL